MTCEGGGVRKEWRGCRGKEGEFRKEGLRRGIRDERIDRREEGRGRIIREEGLGRR